jgi:signal transduction histidine kinase
MASRLEDLHLAWWTLAAAFAAAELVVYNLSGARDRHFFSLFEVPLVIGLLFSSPPTIVLAQALGGGAAAAMLGRRKPVGFAFDVAQRTAGTLVAVFVFAPITQVVGSGWPALWLAAFGATLTAHAVDGMLTNAAIALSQGVRMRFEQVLGIGTALAFAKTALALACAMIITQYPAGVLLLAVPTAAAYLAGRAYVAIRRDRDGILLQQQVIRLAQRSLHPDRMLPLLLEHLRQTFHADIAELLLPDGANKGYLTSRIGPGGAVTILAPVDPDPTQGVWARIAAERKGVLLARPIQNPHLAEHFGSLGITDAIVAPVSCQEGRVGMLTIADREEGFSTFTMDDLRLLQALAEQLDLTLGNARLTQRLQAALSEETERNELKDDFLATISLELRSALSSLQGSVKRMGSAGHALSEREREGSLAEANKAGERLRSLIEELLYASRVETPVARCRLEAVALAGLVGRVVEDRMDHVEAGRIVLRFPPSVPPVWTNEEDVRRIVSDLLGNALRYSPPDACVTVSAEADGAGVRVLFRDRGSRIPGSERERIFDRFYQPDHSLTRPNGRVGLGLHVCRRRAESLGGRVWLDRSDDSGSVFCLWLPVRDRENAGRHDARINPHSLQRSVPRITPLV